MSQSTFAQVYAAAPDLLNTPSLAVSAASSEDPTGAAQGLAHLNTTVAMQQATQDAQQVHGHSWWQGAIHAVLGNKVVAPALNALGAPLRVVQHEYRYLHDVYAHRNLFAAIGETLGVAAAGAVGTVFGGPQVGMLAAEAVGGLESQVFYRNEWKRSANEKISPGRDIANLLGAGGNTDSGFGKYVSGAIDTSFDFSADPLIKVGGLNAARKTVEGLSGSVKTYKMLGDSIAEKQQTVNTFMSKVLRAPGLNANSPERVDAAWKAYPQYRRAAAHIATLDAGGIITHYGPEMAPLAHDLSAAKTAAEVNNVFRDSSFATQMDQQLRTGLLPTRTVMRVTANKLLDKMAGDVQRADERPIVLGKKRFVNDLTDENGNVIGQANAQGLQLGIALRPDLWIKSDAWKAVASRKLRTFSGYAPYAVDDATGELSSAKIDLSDDTNLQGLLRAARFALGERTARKWVDNFASLRDDDGVPHAGLRAQAYGQLLPEILKAAGMVNDPDAVAYLTKWSRHAAVPGLHTTAYGYGHDLGDDVNMVVGDDSTERYALHSHQAESVVSLPNFRALRTAMRDSSQYTKWYGKLDDFAAHYYTNNFFKPLALLTLGFGMRIAAAEAIPASFRYGAYNMLRARVASSAAKMKYTLADGEDHQIIAAASKAVGGVDRLINNPDDRNLAYKLVMANEGHIARGVASAGPSSYVVPDDPNNQASHGIDQSLKRLRYRTPNGDFKNYTPEDPDYVDAWQYGFVRRTQEYNVQNTAADYKAHLDRGFSPESAQQYATEREAQRIDGVDPGTGQAYGVARNAKGNLIEDPYVIERKRLVRYNKQDPQTFAAHRVDDMVNYVTGRDGTLHEPLLQKFIDGDKNVTTQELRDIDINQRPAGVAGEVLEFHLGNVYQHVVSTGFKRMIDPVINGLSREPIYFNEFKQQYRALEPAVKAGRLKEDSAMTLAQIRATRAILPQIHNTALRSQFAIMATNFVPFYFAQEQALKRAGHLIRRDPTAFRKYQLVEQGLNDPGFVQKDGYGGKHFVFPLIGEFGSTALGAMSHVPLLGQQVEAGLPLTVTGNMQSLQTMLPELQYPKASPFAAIALSSLAAIDPAFSKFASPVLGQGYNEDLLRAVIPNTALRSAVEALRASDGDRTYANALLTSLQSAYYHGQMPDPATASPIEMHKFMVRMRNNARSMLMIKAIVAEGSPLAPTVSNEDSGLREEFTKMLDKMPYEDAIAKFIAEHGDKSVSYTVARTQTATGASVPYTGAVFDYLTKHENLVGKHPWGLAFAAPTNGKAVDSNSLVTYNELLRTGLSQRRDPDEFVQAINSTAGVRVYLAAKQAFDAELAKVAGTPQEAALRSGFDQWKNINFRLSEPIAYDHLFGPTAGTQAIHAYQDIVKMFNDGSAPQTDQSQKLLTLVRGYESTRSQLARLGEGTGDRSGGTQRQNVRDAWAAYLDGVVKNDPTLSSVVSSVFSRLEV